MNICFFIKTSHAIFEEASRPTEPNLQVKIPFIDFSPIGEQKTVTFGDTEYEKWEIYWIREYVAGLYKFALATAGIIAVVMIMIGGVLYATAGGNQNKITQGMEYISSAVAGLVILIFAYMILWLINANIVQTQGIITYGLKIKESEFLEQQKRKLDMAVYQMHNFNCDKLNSKNGILYLDQTCNNFPIGPNFNLNCIRYKNRSYYSKNKIGQKINDCYDKHIQLAPSGALLAVPTLDINEEKLNKCLKEITDKLGNTKKDAINKCKKIINDKDSRSCVNIINQACSNLEQLQEAEIINPNTNKKVNY